MRRALVTRGLLALLTWLVLGPAYAQDVAAPSGEAATWTEHARLVPAESLPFDHFGYSVALEGPLAVVGAPYDGYEPREAGAVAVFERSAEGFGEPTWLRASEPAEAALFGVSVAVSGDVIVIGAPGVPLGDARNVGAAYVFVRDGAGFVQRAILRASDAVADGVFGWSVAVSGEIVVVGTRPQPAAEGLTPSAAYVFAPSGEGYAELARLVPPGPPEQDRFGLAVAVQGDTVVVGAPLAAGGAGSVHVFARSGATYVSEAVLRSSSGDTGERFGAAVALSGARLLVGAVGNAARGERAGAAYVFVRSGATWSEEATLFAQDTDVGDYFGSAVALSGDRAIVAALRDGERGVGGGSAHVFVRGDDAWHERGRSAPLPEPTDRGYLRAVAISGELALVGARDGATSQMPARAVWIMAPGPAPGPLTELPVYTGSRGPGLAGQLGPSPRQGCGCRVGGKAAGVPAPLTLAVLVALARIARPRRRR